MNDEIQKINKELNLLKEKYKKKCDKLKKATEQINYFILRNERRDTWTHCRHIEHTLLREMTNHVDRFVYEVKFKYNEQFYTEPQITSYGTRWLKECLIYFLGDKKNLIAYDHEIDIISAKKLW